MSDRLDKLWAEFRCCVIEGQDDSPAMLLIRELERHRDWGGLEEIMKLAGRQSDVWSRVGVHAHLAWRREISRRGAAIEAPTSKGSRSE
jgi:hypothetical protein